MLEVLSSAFSIDGAMSGTDRRDQTEKGERVEMGDAGGSGASQCSSLEAGEIT